MHIARDVPMRHGKNTVYIDEQSGCMDQDYSISIPRNIPPSTKSAAMGRRENQNPVKENGNERNDAARKVACGTYASKT